MIRREKRENLSLLRGDRLFYAVNGIVLTVFFLIVLLPLLHVVSASFSSPEAVTAGRVFVWPVEFGLRGYGAVFENPDVMTGFRNSILYTLLGTLVGLSMTLICAYPLARKSLPHRNFFMFLFTFTMLFNGGMIPTYILIRDLGMINKVWAMIVPGAIGVYNMFIMRTFIQETIPGDMLEAAQIDGCSDARFFVAMVLPLSKAVIAVVSLYYAVGHWNAYFNAFLYLNKKELFPLQIVMREILIQNTVDQSMILDSDAMLARQNLADQLKYSLIVVSSLPMILLFPFIQRHFVKGVMIGAIKG